MKYKDLEPKISDKAYIIGNAVVVGDTTIGENSSVWFNATVRGDMSRIVIGKGTNIQDNAVIHTDTSMPTIIGDYVTVGHSAIIHAATVGNNALIGMGSVILNGAIIEDDAMIAAGTIVPPGKVVPRGTLALGNPMKIIRNLKESEINKNIENAIKYIDLAQSYK